MVSSSCSPLSTAQTHPPAHAFLVLLSHLSRIERAFGEEYDLTPQLARTLLAIYEFKPCCVRKLTELLDIHPTATSKLLGRLELRGLLVRSMDPVDHRMERVTLTETGTQKAVALTDTLPSMLDLFNESSLSQFIQIEHASRTEEALRSNTPTSRPS